MSIRYETNASTIQSRRTDTQGQHRTRAKSNRDSVRQSALSVTSTWKGAAQAKYAARAALLYSAMEKPESDLQEFSRRIDMSRNALRELVSNTRGYTSG